MILTITRPTKRLSRSGLVLEPIGESMWAVRRSGEEELVAELGLSEFKSQGPSATLFIGKSS